MKKILCYILISCCLLSGCNKIEMEESPYQVVDNGLDFTLSIIENTVTSKGISMTLTNAEEQQLQYGEWFSIEKKIGDKWYVLPYVKQTDNVVILFSDVALFLESGATKSINYSWDKIYGEISNGEYRLIILVKYNTQNYYISDTFTIK